MAGYPEARKKSELKSSLNIQLASQAKNALDVQALRHGMPTTVLAVRLLEALSEEPTIVSNLLEEQS